MSGKILYILMFILLFPIRGVLYSQTEGRIENGRIIIRVNLDWDEAKRQEFARQFEIDSLLIEKIFTRQIPTPGDSSPWTITLIDAKTLELSKYFEQAVIQHPDDLMFLKTFSPNVVRLSQDIQIGYNMFMKPGTFSYQNGEARFFLKGYNNAKTVYLAGTFNEWSTTSHPMTRVDSGWIIQLKLVPGEYEYRYVAGGKWITDPVNERRRPNDQDGYNSLVVCPNHVFSLKGYTDARKVFLSGNFNNWRPNQIKMEPTGDGWKLPVFLPEGTHFYKFVINGNWITDPDNPKQRSDSNGNINSLLEIGDSYRFFLPGHADAKQVILTGSFNNWRNEELLMNRVEDGWELNYILPQKMHEYKFIVDGKWITDPKNPYTTGSGDYMNSIMVFHPNYTFVLKGYTEAREVSVSGSFNGWPTSGYRMLKEGDQWICPVYLSPGKHTYKFIVDGQWILDPANSLWQENEFGTGNSVLWINSENPD